MTWDDFIALRHRDLSDNHGYELRFVREVLARVATLHPDSVEHQKRLRDSTGRERRIDFAICEGEHVRIAIEVDGWDKRGRGEGMNRAEMDDYLVRQNSLSQQGWVVLRFLNTRFTRNADDCVREIERTLLLARKNAVELARRAPVVEGALQRAVNVPAVVATAAEPHPNAPSRPAKENHLMAAGVVALALVGVVVFWSSGITREPAKPGDLGIESPPPAQPDGSVANGWEEWKKQNSIEMRESSSGPVHRPSTDEKRAPDKHTAKSLPPEAINADAGAAKPPLPSTPATVAATDAHMHIDEIRIVCGTVVDARWAGKGQPTFLNFGDRFPNHVFSVYIMFDARKSFRDELPQDPEKHYLHRHVCVTGKIEERDGKPRVRAETPRDISAVDS